MDLSSETAWLQKSYKVYNHSVEEDLIIKQVSDKKYTVIGSGNLATHLSHYLTLLNIPHHQWSRNGDPKYNSLWKKIPLNTTEQLHILTEKSEFLLICISDQSIIPLTLSLKRLFPKKYFVHFSGALYHENILGVHPLMTFSKQLYTLKQYKQIPLTLDFQEGPKSLFSELPNNHWTITPDKKPLYHSLCSVVGNLTQYLWQESFQKAKSIPMPKELFSHYIKQTLENAFNESPLTGPAARKDMLTLQKQKKALEGSSLLPIYQEFINAVNPSVEPTSKKTMEETYEHFDVPKNEA